HRLHAEIAEPARVKEPSTVSLPRQHRGKPGSRDLLVVFRLRVEGRPGRALHGKETADRFRIRRVGIFEKDGVAAQLRQVGHWILGRTVRSKATGTGRFKVDDNDVSATS